MSELSQTACIDECDGATTKAIHFGFQWREEVKGLAPSGSPSEEHRALLQHRQQYCT